MNIINYLKRVNKFDIEKIDSKCVILPINLYEFNDLEINNQYIKIFNKLINFMKYNYDIKIEISKYDLFHGHLYQNKKNGDLEILFHIREYPKDFPLDLGYCQKESNIVMDSSFKHRNIKYKINKDEFEVLYPINPDITNTVREAILGKPIIDIFTLNNQQIYISLR